MGSSDTEKKDKEKDDKPCQGFSSDKGFLSLMGWRHKKYASEDIYSMILLIQWNDWSEYRIIC